MAEAFAAVNADELTIIEIADNGPIFVPVLPALAQRKIHLRGAEGYRPLIVWDVANKSPPVKMPTAFCTVADSKLMVENIDFAMSWSDDVPAALFDLPDTYFHARDCTFSIAGKAKEGVALLRRHKGKQVESQDAHWLQCRDDARRLNVIVVLA